MSGGVKRSKRRTLWSRDGGRCHYCQAAVTLTEASFDHIWPRALGGSSANDNLVTSCLPCNEGFGDDTDKCRCDFCAAAMRSELAANRPPPARTYRGRGAVATLAEIAGFRWTADGWKPYREGETP